MTRRPTRPASAPLEFVLVLPLLLLLAAGIFLVGRAGTYKAFVASKARHDSWAMRPKTDPGQVLQLVHAPTDSVAERTARREFESGLLRERLRAESRNPVIANTWGWPLPGSNRQTAAIPFDTGHDGFDPHADELEMIALSVPGLGKGVGVGLTVALAAFGATLDPDRNPLFIAAAGVGRVANPIIRFQADQLKFFSRALSGVKLALRGIRAVYQATIGWILDLFDNIPMPRRWKRELNRVRGFVNQIDRAISLIDIGITVVDNLWDASRGRKGRDGILDVKGLADRLSNYNRNRVSGGIGR